jgi:hypothetical protein
MNEQVRYDTLEGEAELEKAFRTVTSVGAESITAGAATLLTIGHGAAALPDREYVLALLDIVNRNLAVHGQEVSDVLTEEAANALARRIAEHSPKEGPIVSMYGKRLNSVVSLLDEIRADPATAARRHGPEWRKTTAKRVLSYPTGEVDDNGSPVHVSVIRDVDATYAHVFGLLTKPTFHGQLRRCALCGRFFLFDGSKSGRPPVYCPDNDSCSQEADRRKALKRMRDLRPSSRARRRIPAKQK